MNFAQSLHNEIQSPVFDEQTAWLKRAKAIRIIALNNIKRCEETNRGTLVRRENVEELVTWTKVKNFANQWILEGDDESLIKTIEDEKEADIEDEQNIQHREMQRVVEKASGTMKHVFGVNMPNINERDAQQIVESLQGKTNEGMKKAVEIVNQLISTKSTNK